MNIFVAGHNGMVGSSIVRQLIKLAIDPKSIITKNRTELNLLNQVEVENFFQNHKIDQVYLAAAKVGGIHANNSYPASFLYENLMIQSNIINSAYQNSVKKLLFLGSSCIYPKGVVQPMKESALLTDKLEPTNEPYAIAKIAGIKMCESYNRQYNVDYRSIMPTNLYGPGDNFHPENSHVIPGLILRFHNAVKDNNTEVTIWGSGKPKREFLYVDDMAAASIHLMNLEKNIYEKNTEPMQSHINAGSGVDCSIQELAEIIAKVTGFKGKLKFDTTKPDGTMRKLLDVTKLKSLGWQPKTDLHEGLKKSYEWFLNNPNLIRN